MGIKQTKKRVCKWTNSYKNASMCTFCETICYEIFEILNDAQKNKKRQQINEKKVVVSTNLRQK